MKKDEKSSDPKLSNQGFVVDRQIRDFYADIQHNAERIGDVGEVSKDFLDSAFHQLAKEGDEFIAPDTYGTDGREDNKNVNRMEYDTVERNDGLDSKTVLKQANSKKEISVKDLLAALRPNKDGFTLDTSHTETGEKPIK